MWLSTQAEVLSDAVWELDVERKGAIRDCHPIKKSIIHSKCVLYRESSESSAFRTCKLPKLHRGLEGEFDLERDDLILDFQWVCLS